MQQENLIFIFKARLQCFVMPWRVSATQQGLTRGHAHLHIGKISHHHTKCISLYLKNRKADDQKFGRKEKEGEDFTS